MSIVRQAVLAGAAIAAAALTCAAGAAEDQDIWDVAPDNVTSTFLAEQHAALIASTAIAKTSGRTQTVTYWEMGGRNYRCIDISVKDLGTVNAYCFEQKLPTKAKRSPGK